MNDEIRIRDAGEDDADAVVALFRAAYGDTYVHPQIYDLREVRRMIYDEDVLMLVAEEGSSGRIVGTAGVLYEMGAYSDLVGEFGRLVVAPDMRRRGIGHRLMEERLARVGHRLHVGFVEVRVGTSHSARISQAHGFSPVGALPQKLVFGATREHAGLLVRYFGDALALRRNNPRIVPEAHRLATTALRAAGITPDAIVDEDAVAYPRGNGLELEGLDETGYSSLLRIQRGRVRHREVFGPQRLHYGLFRLEASGSRYLVARRDGEIVGALGFMCDAVERFVRVFEVIHAEEGVIHPLFEALRQTCVEEGLVGAEVDVGAHATRMQRTLLEAGYLPAAYVPAMVFHDVERIDVIKMYRLFQPLMELPFEAPEPTRSVGMYVLERFQAQEIQPRIARAMERLEICHGLTEEQSERLVVEFDARTVGRNETIFSTADDADEMLLILEGDVRIEIDGRLVGSVGPGECLGEVAFMSESPHSATAVAESDLEVAVLTRSSLHGLVRSRPDIGTVVYRNLATGLGAKLRRADGVG